MRTLLKTLYALLLTGATCTAGEPLRVVATTTLVGDAVQRVGSTNITLHVLIPPGRDPHLYEPTPRDMALLSDADVIFINGIGLENFMKSLTHHKPEAELVSVSEGIALRHATEEHHDHDHDHGEDDPHVWLNPLNVIVWVNNIEKKLSTLDPEHATSYRDNANRYVQELTALDAWIQQEIQKIKPEHRMLITDHDEWGYFAERYGFVCEGTLLPSVSTLAEPMAQHIAELQGIIRAKKIGAIFVGKTSSPTLAKRIAKDEKISVVSLYTGSLGDAGGEAGNYLDYMKYNVSAMVDVLGSQP